MSFYSITYCVLLPPEDLSRYSPFQGYPSELLPRHWVFTSVIQLLPSTILELYRFSYRTIQQRIAGVAAYTLFPLNHTDLTHIAISPDQPFWVVLADEETHEVAESWQKTSDIPPLIIRYDRDFKEAEPRKPLRRRLHEHCESVFKVLEAKYRTAIPEHTDEIREGKVFDDEINAKFTFHNHNTTAPNEFALLSIGCTFEGPAKPPFGNDEDYVSAIVQSADELASLKAHIPLTNLYVAARPACTLILSAPALYQHVYQTRKPKDRPSSEEFKMLRLLQKQKTYALSGEEAEMKQLMDSPKGMAVLHTRTMELHTYTSAIAVRAASYLCPVLRLPPAINHVMPNVIQLEDTLFARQPHIRKIGKMAKRVFDALTETVDPKFLERIDQPHTHVKVISDVPLEWLPVRGLPLCLRHSTSRLPVTPGALSFAGILPPPDIYLTLEHFKEVLVVRSFQKNDPLRDHLKIACDAYALTNGEPLPVRFVDVRNREEFLGAINDFTGALAIFDGHGTHPKSEGVGKLVLADEIVDTWSLYPHVNMPPIFFTCACNTHAVNRSHITPTNGLLKCGARALISTVLPIRSTPAATLAGRLLFRIFELLPGIIGGISPQTVRWDEVFSMLQRMAFVSEFMRTVISRDILDEEKSREVQVQCTHIIHREDLDWYERVLDLIAEGTGKSAEELIRRQHEQMPFPEIVKYLQMGNPETIIVGPTEPHIEWFSDLEPVSVESDALQIQDSTQSP